MKRVMTLCRVSTKKQYDNVHDDIPMQRLACQEFVEHKRETAYKKIRPTF